MPFLWKSFYYRSFFFLDGTQRKAKCSNKDCWAANPDCWYEEDKLKELLKVRKTDWIVERCEVKYEYPEDSKRDMIPYIKDNLARQMSAFVVNNGIIKYDTRKSEYGLQVIRGEMTVCFNKKKE